MRRLASATARLCVIDAAAGLVIVDPGSADEETVRRIREAKSPTPLSGLSPVPRTTKDGVPVALLLNISDPLEAENATAAGLAGVGLFRTEFLYMDRASWPDEEDSFQSYHRVAAALGEGELHIRLADFGAEKCPAYADIPVNRNPSLGIRGIRLLLARLDILEPQVRALARLARIRPLTVLLPMIDTLDTLLQVRGELGRICGVAEGEGLPFRLGSMVEVPSAALLIEDIIGHIDSVSVGLNDLTQYLLAADRDDEFVESYHDPLQPVVLRMLHQIVRVADAHGKPVTMCGELAGDPKLTALMLALGVRRISVSRSHVGRIGAALGDLSISDVAALGPAVLRLFDRTGRATVAPGAWHDRLKASATRQAVLQEPRLIARVRANSRSASTSWGDRASTYLNWSMASSNRPWPRSATPISKWQFSRRGLSEIAHAGSSRSLPHNPASRHIISPGSRRL